MHPIHGDRNWETKETRQRSAGAVSEVWTLEELDERAPSMHSSSQIGTAESAWGRPGQLRAADNQSRPSTETTRPLDTRCRINTQEKSTSAPKSGRQRRDFQPPPLRQFFLNLGLKQRTKPQGMNTLQPKYHDFQDFRTISTSRSGLMSHFLNTLRKTAGEGERAGPPFITALSS